MGCESSNLGKIDDIKADAHVADVDIVCNICKKSFSIDDFFGHDISVCSFVVWEEECPTCYCGESFEDAAGLEDHNYKCDSTLMDKPYPKPELSPKLIFKLSPNEAILAWPTKIDRYKGPVRENGKELIPHGEEGIVIYGGLLKGDKYKGSFVNGQRHGKGRLWRRDGLMYVGDFKDDKQEGKGYQTDNIRMESLANSYTGEFMDGKPHGRGTYTYRSGETYTGEFVDGKRNGRGTYTFSDGAKYIGEWVDGDREGYGRMVDSEGALLQEGVYKAGKFCGARAKVIEVQV